MVYFITHVCIVVKGSSACVWSVCGARKAPLVASDSSSSGTDSEEDEERTSISTEAVATGNTKEAIKMEKDCRRYSEWSDFDPTNTFSVSLFAPSTVSVTLLMS